MLKVMPISKAQANQRAGNKPSLLYSFTLSAVFIYPLSILIYILSLPCQPSPLTLIPTSFPPSIQPSLFCSIGRAGRESEGRCFRLFPESTFENLETVTIPEIQRVNVAQVVLQLTKMGSSPLTFPYVSPPSQEVLRKALEMLLILGALEKDMSLSPHGVR